MGVEAKKPSPGPTVGRAPTRRKYPPLAGNHLAFGSRNKFSYTQEPFFFLHTFFFKLFPNRFLVMSALLFASCASSVVTKNCTAPLRISRDPLRNPEAGSPPLHSAPSPLRLVSGLIVSSTTPSHQLRYFLWARNFLTIQVSRIPLKLTLMLGLSAQRGRPFSFARKRSLYPGSFCPSLGPPSSKSLFIVTPFKR